MARLNVAAAYDGRAASAKTAMIVPLDERRAEAARVAAESEADPVDLDDVFEEPARRGF